MELGGVLSVLCQRIGIPFHFTCHHICRYPYRSCCPFPTAGMEKNLCVGSIIVIARVFMSVFSVSSLDSYPS